MSSHSFGKGSHSEGSTNNSFSPPDWARPLFEKLSTDLNKLYNNKEGGNVYNGKTVADLSDVSKDSINGLLKNANRFDNAYFNSLMQEGAAQHNLEDMASGKFVGNNPSFNAALNNALNSASDTINSQMSGLGRYGSGANNSILANKLGNIAQNANAQQYNQDIANMLKANSQIDNYKMNKLANNINLLNDQSNAYDRALRGGRLIDNNQQNILDAQRRNWQDQDNAKLNRIKIFEDLLNGAAGRYGNNTSQRSSDTSDNIWSSMSKFMGRIIGK